MPVLPDQPRPSAVRRALYAANLPPDRWRVALLLAVTGPGALAGDAFRNGVELQVALADLYAECRKLAGRRAASSFGRPLGLGRRLALPDVR